VKLAYLGTPEMAVPPLDALIDAGHEVSLVVTRPDARRGRGSALSGSPVKQRALERGLHVSHDPEDLIPLAKSGKVELAVVVAYGRILKPHLLAELEFVNLHFSLLPRWRGAAPVERALLAGDEVTGVCLMRIEEGLDTGPVYARTEVPIGQESTAVQLRAQLVEAGVGLLLTELDHGLGAPTPQEGEPTIAHKLSSDMMRIDWSRSAVEIHRLIRVGGAWTTFRGSRIKIVAATLEHPEHQDKGVQTPCEPVLHITRVQPEGKPQMEMSAWRNGVRLAADEWFQ
jgi:methionyl-tRNA formyltransferase